MSFKAIGKIKSGEIIDISTPEDGAAKLALVHNVIYRHGEVVGFHLFKISTFNRGYTPPSDRILTRLPSDAAGKYSLSDKSNYYIHPERIEFIPEENNLSVFDQTEKSPFVMRFLKQRDAEIITTLRTDDKIPVIKTDKLPTHVTDARKGGSSNIFDIAIDDLTIIPELQLSDDTKSILEALGIKRLKTANSLVTAKGEDYAKLRSAFESATKTQGFDSFTSEIKSAWTNFIALTLSNTEDLPRDKIGYDKDEKKPKLPAPSEPNISVADAASEDLSYFEDERTSYALRTLGIKTLREAYITANERPATFLINGIFNKKAQTAIVEDIKDAWDAFEENAKEQPEDFPRNIRIFHPV